MESIKNICRILYLLDKSLDTVGKNAADIIAVVKDHCHTDLYWLTLLDVMRHGEIIEEAMANEGFVYRITLAGLEFLEKHKEG